MEKPPKITLWFGDEPVDLSSYARPEKPTWNTGNSCIDHILNGEPFNPLLQSSELSEHRSRWRDELRSAVGSPPAADDLAEVFHTQWHVGHHFIRELVDDDCLLLELAKAWLPPYEGPALTLFRGENIDRLERGSIGSAWSDQEEVAATFARGLNAVGKGGVVLRTLAPAKAIIAGPSRHSAEWLREREFTVDPQLLGRIERVRGFPPAFGA